MKIEDYLTIAGIAYRRIIDVNSLAEATQDAFPKGPDDLELMQEIAICNAIIANSRALITGQMLELSFTAGGRAVAQTPDVLRGSEYDQGSHSEPVK